MKIADKVLKNNLILAPMAGFTALPLRKIMSENGAGLTVSEMISTKALLYSNQKTAQMLDVDGAERVKCAQLFGSEPDDFFHCASLPILKDFDIIDVNMGCSVKKIVRSGDGSALMSSPKKAAEIIKSIKKAGRVVTAKTRLGVKDKNEIFDFALRLEDAGLDMLAVHGRTAMQLFSGESDFSFVPRLKARLNIPLVVNGDINRKTDLDKIGADGYMIGRGALIDPSIFLHFIGENDKNRELILALLDYMGEYYGVKRAAIEIRKFLPYLLKGIMGGKEVRINAMTCENIAELKAEIEKLAII